MTKKLLQSGYIFSALVLFLLSVLTTHAQSLCGDFVLIEEFEGEVYEERSPIEDCENPFGADEPVPFAPTLEVGGEMISEGEVVMVSEQEPVIIKGLIPEDENYSPGSYGLYKEQGTDLLLVFEGPINQEPSLNLEPGLYTAVFQRSSIGTEVTLQPSFPQRILEWFIPTAYAYVYFKPPSVEAVTISFSVEFLPEVTGASSILFLPGIQASRLYKEGILGFEDQVWPPNSLLFAEDVYDLSMDTTGVSDNPIYTRDIIDSTAGVGDIYANFVLFLNQLKTQGIINNWEPYAYDWRYSVADVAQNGTQYENEVKGAIAEIERLSENSLSGKVTIIGHSNGGLLAKAITRRLEAEGKDNLIDKIIFLASPQLGTPKSIGTILHGYDQTDSYGGFVTNASAAREVINNLPGAYGLLPSEKYFEGLDVPLVTFSDTSVTSLYRQTYGSNITTFGDYVRFLEGEDGFDRDINGPVSTPARANTGMLNAALSMHSTELDNWIAPSNIEVIEIVGTGLPTMKSVEYREIVEDKCLSAGPLQVCTPQAEIKPYAVLTKYGDRTVVQRSAEGYIGQKEKYFVNLVEVNKTSSGNIYEHFNITEATSLQNLLKNIVTGTTTSNDKYVSTSYTEFNDPYDVEMIDSPVRLLATDTVGNQTGVIVVDGVRVIKQEIPGSQYFEFGDTKYFVVPKGTNRTTKLFGEDYGGYTLTTASLDTNDTQTIQTVLENASTSPSMLAEYSNSNGTFSTVLTDSDGDGTVDLETTLNGEVIEEEVIITYPVLIATVNELNLSKSRKQALLLIIKTAEYYANKTPSKVLFRNLEDALLKSAQELVKLYLKKRYITSTDATDMLGMIEVLKNKQ